MYSVLHLQLTELLLLTTERWPKDRNGIANSLADFGNILI